jgi:hypothetical protein
MLATQAPHGNISGCSRYDADGSNGSHRGAAPAGLIDDHVYGFVKV